MRRKVRSVALSALGAGVGVLAMSSPAAGQVSVSAEQLLINQRISQAAILRADAIEQALDGIGAQSSESHLREKRAPFGD